MCRRGADAVTVAAAAAATAAQDRPVKFKELLHEYKHSAGHANSEEAAGGKFITRVGDIHTSHAVLHELAPASRQVRSARPLRLGFASRSRMGSSKPPNQTGSVGIQLRLRAR